MDRQPKTKPASSVILPRSTSEHSTFKSLRPSPSSPSFNPSSPPPPHSHHHTLSTSTHPTTTLRSFRSRPSSLSRLNHSPNHRSKLAPRSSQPIPPSSILSYTHQPRSFTSSSEEENPEQGPHTNPSSSTISSTQPTSSHPSNSCRSPPQSHPQTDHDHQPFETTKALKQLVLRARLHQPTHKSTSFEPIHPHPNHSRVSNLPQPSCEGLQVMMWIHVAIPCFMIPSPGSPDLTLPLMSDHKLRLRHHYVFPLTRRSPRSKPTIQASKHSHQASIAASMLNLSKSFRVQNPNLLSQSPPISVTIRNFAVSLVVSPLPSSAHSHSALNDHPTLLEYAIVLDCLSLWATVGPEWPFSVILPTPPCLKNSFRLLLPTEPTTILAGSTQHTLQPSALNTANTFPPLRREHQRFSTLPRTISSLSQHNTCHDKDFLPLSDESEPEGISLSYEEDELDFDPRINWVQDSLSPRIEGVFQSSQDLCILLGSHSQISHSSRLTSIDAKHALSQLSISLQRASTTTTTKSNLVAIDLNFHAELQNVTTRSISNRVPFVLAISQPVADSILSAQWSPLNGEGVLDTKLPQPCSEQTQRPTDSLTVSRPLSASSLSNDDSISPVGRQTSDTFNTELELLNTPPPFLSSKLEFRDETVQDDLDVDLNFAQSSPSTRFAFDPQGSRGTSLRTSSSSPRYQFVAWIDTQWLIRGAATKSGSVNSRLIFNLHGQLDLFVRSHPNTDGTSDNLFPIPFLMLPSVDEHDCTCHISGAPTDLPSHKELRFTLPPWATMLEQSPDAQSHHIKLALNKQNTQSNDSIMAHLHDLVVPKPVDTLGIHKNPEGRPSSVHPSLAEPNLSTKTLMVKPARRIKYHDRRSTISFATTNRKRPRLHNIMKSKSIKIPAPIHEAPTSLLESQFQAEPRIQSVQIESVIDRSASSPPSVSQFVETLISMCRSTERDVPTINITFPTVPDGSLEILSIWMGDCELIQDQDFQLSPAPKVDDESGQSAHLVTIKLNHRRAGSYRRDDICGLLSVLRMIVKSNVVLHPHNTGTPNDDQASENSRIDSFQCTLPSFDRPVTVYKALIQTCAGFQIEMNDSNILILEGSCHSSKLIHYSLPSKMVVYGSGLIKASNCRSSTEFINPRSTDRQLQIGGLSRRVETNIVKDSTSQLSTYEKYAIRWGISWKTVLLCWLIYLVSFLNTQMDQIDARLNRMDEWQQTFHQSLFNGRSSGQVRPFDDSVDQLHEQERSSSESLNEPNPPSTTSLPSAKMEWKRSILRSILNPNGDGDLRIVDRFENVLRQQRKSTRKSEGSDEKKIDLGDQPNEDTFKPFKDLKFHQEDEDEDVHHQYTHENDHVYSKDEDNERSDIIKSFLGKFDRFMIDQIHEPYLKIINLFKKIWPNRLNNRYFATTSNSHHEF